MAVHHFDHIGATPVCVATERLLRSIPGSGDYSAFVGFLVGFSALPTQADIPAEQLACLRRLWYEAHAVSLSDIRACTETAEYSPARRLPIPERASDLLPNKFD